MKSSKKLKNEKPDLRHQLLVKKSSAGLGLFAKEPIKKGTFIIEYVGPLLNDEQVQKKGGKYLFALGKKWTIDGTSRANIARYINHSCRPNCEPMIKGGRVFIFSKRAIKPGEELNYHYGQEYFDGHLKKLGCRCAKCQEARAR